MFATCLFAHFIILFLIVMHTLIPHILYIVIHVLHVLIATLDELTTQDAYAMYCTPLPAQVGLIIGLYRYIDYDH